MLYEKKGRNMPPPGEKPKPEDIALDMVTNLMLLNAKLAGAEPNVLTEVHGLLDTLCGHFDVVHLAMGKIADLKAEGKIKIGIAEFAQAWSDAADEILPEDDDPEDPEGDILVPHR